MVRYKCPKCGRTVERPIGTYYCAVCGPSVRMVSVWTPSLISPRERLPEEVISVRLQVFLYVSMAPRTREEIADVFGYEHLKDLDWFIKSGELAYVDGKYMVTEAGKKRIPELKRKGIFRYLEKRLRKLGRFDEIKTLKAIERSQI